MTDHTGGRPPREGAGEATQHSEPRHRHDPADGAASGGRGGAPPEPRDSRGWRAARRLRSVVQALSLLLFVYLLFAALQRRDAHEQADLFFRLDPLAAFATMLAAREWLPHLALALATVALTLALGRVWCGWVCPMGTLLEWFRFRRAGQRAARLSPRLRRAKYWLLTTVGVMAALGSLTLLVFDPVSLLTRTATVSLLPALDLAVTASERLMLRWPTLEPLVNGFEQRYRGTVLPVIQPRFDQALALFLLFVAIVVLDALADRFWCRYLCPLGALLGLLAKLQVARPSVGDGCNACGTCALACRLGAIERPDAPNAATGSAQSHPVRTSADDPVPADRRAAVASSECTMCLDCLVACPRRDAMGFRVAKAPGPWQTYDPGRRSFLGGAAAGLGAVLLLGTGTWRTRPRTDLVRPPGSQDEARFLSRCLRCSECMKVCPTSGLQPALGQAGLEGIWTPVLVSRLGYCDYACNACGQVCPSGAIPELSMTDKRAQVLGLAVIDRDRCLPWAQDTPCIVCQEMCPIPKKAIELTGERLITHEDGSQDYLSRPVVAPDRCIGCGLCEHRCPVEGTAAIVVQRRNAALVAPEAPVG